MMFEHKDYSIPEGIEMLPQTAQQRGYQTAFITNVGRWYQRGVDHFIDCRRWAGKKIFGVAKNMIKMMMYPWFLIVHTDDMHRNYTGGSYQAAARAVDCYIDDLLRAVEGPTTDVYITSDHGEGLGEKGIKQHGYGLWPFLTHVPLLSNAGIHDSPSPVPGVHHGLTDPGSLYDLMRWSITNVPPPLIGRQYVFQVGDTPPNLRHRGVVYRDKLQFVRATRGGEVVGWSRLPESPKWADRKPEDLLRDHCRAYDINYDTEEVDSTVEERLRGLGYFD
jgi:arylsulfatase A-like enzyme